MNRMDNYPKRYRIVTLAENLVYGRGLQAEHGLSLYIETPTHKLLFDTGASDLFIRNAAQLNIDLHDVDYLVLSHGHSDHTGGLHAFLELNSRATVVCKETIFDRKFKEVRENGILEGETIDRRRFRFVKEQTELLPGIFLFPDIPLLDAVDTHFEHFFVMRTDHRVPDTFEDEMVLVLTDGSSFSILSACSHRGITNIIRRVREAFPTQNFRLLQGGFHIHNAENEKFDAIANYFEHDCPQQIAVCHCTGVDKYALLQQHFGDKVVYEYTGEMIEIP